MLQLALGCLTGPAHLSFTIGHFQLPAVFGELRGGCGT
jgi:hypothetical protein